MRDLEKLVPTEHMLKWLAEEPYDVIVSEVERILDQQVVGSTLTEFRVTSDPQWLTGARPQEDDSNQAILTRTAVAFEFDLAVQEPNGPTHQLQGVFTWVGVHLDDPENAQLRIWFDVGESLETHGADGELQTRMYFD